MSDHGLGGPGPGRLPVHLAELFGREPDVAGLTTALGRTRLLTLVGAPGCGKTRLAVEVAHRTAGSWPGGVWFVDLAPVAPVAEGSSVAAAVALALGLREQPRRAPAETLVELLGGSTHPLLLVLDNCEHLVDAAAALAGRLLGACPAVQVLATSRVPLGVPGEQVWEVPPLPAEAARCLFVDRATLASHRFGADPAPEGGNGGDRIDAVCERLGRLPLAIELGAASTRLLGVGQILDRLEQSLPLTGRVDRARRVGARHATMAATVEWSLRLLPPPVQGLFARLSVFAGGFDLAAAEAVGQGSDVDVLAGLTTLVDHSLVVAEPAATGTMRYRLLEPVRQVVAEKLPAGPEGDRVRRRHAEHHLALAHRFDPFGMHGVLRAFPLARVEEDEANLVAALHWARRDDLDLALRLGAALAPFWEFGGRVNEGRAWLDDLLAASAPGPGDGYGGGDGTGTGIGISGREGDGGGTGTGDSSDGGTGTGGSSDGSRERTGDGNGTSGREGTGDGTGTGVGSDGGREGDGDGARAEVRIRLLRGAARLAWRQNDMDRAREVLAECLALARRVGDPGGEAAALCTLGIVAFSEGDHDLALTHGERSLTVARAAGNDVVAIWAGLCLGWAHHMRGEKADGDRVLREVLAANRPHGSPSVRAQAHSALQFGAFVGADVAAQREHLVEILAAMEDGGAVEPADWLGLAIGLARSEGRARSAALLTGGARAFRQRRGSVTPDTVLAPYLRVQTNGALADRLEAEGERMTWEQLVTEALREPASPASHPLTHREAEVAGLVAEGLNNVAIAARLHISRRTVETHVEHVKRKLALTHRHQILTWALSELPPRR